MGGNGNVPVVFFWLVYFADCALHHFFFLKLSDDQLVDNLACIVRMFVTSLGFRTEIALKAVAAMEVLANVSAYAFFQDKFAAWMVLNKGVNVQHEFIKDDVFLSFFNSRFKFCSVHTFLHLGKGILLFKLFPVQKLQNNEDREESNKIDGSQCPSDWHILIDAVVDQNSGCYCDLGEQYKTESKNTMHCFNQQESC